MTGIAASGVAFVATHKMKASAMTIRHFAALGLAVLLGLSAVQWTPKVRGDDAQDLAQLLRGVRQIPQFGSPGSIIPFGPNAFPIILGDAGDGHRLPVAAATRLGKGRIVAFSHGGYMAGNAKEWCWNLAGAGKRFTLGGAWDEPGYLFEDADARSPWDRAANFGFRCVKYFPNDTLEIGRAHV